MKLSLMYYPDDECEEIIKIVKTCEELGFYACYFTDSSLRRDLWVLLGAMAHETSRIRLGPNAVRVLFRDPALIALAIATLDELTRGRVDTVVGFGSSNFYQSHRLEAKQTTRPWARVKEAILVMRQFLDTQSLDFEGEYFRYEEMKTSVAPVQTSPPLKMATIGGPKAMETAGEMADGMHIAPIASRRACEDALERVKAGARRTGRDWRGLDVAVCPIWVCARDGDAAREVARIKVAWYIPLLPERHLLNHGISLDEVKPIREAWLRGDARGAVAMTNPTIAKRLSIAGSPQECVAQLKDQLLDTGVNHLVLMVADAWHAKLISGQTVDGIPQIREQLHLIDKYVSPLL